MYLVALLLLTLPGFNCFFPNRLGVVNFGKETLTHEDITEIGILKAVAAYFEENPRNESTVSPGELVGMEDITTTKLFKRFYGADATGDNLQSVIDNINRYNSYVYEEYFHVAHWHWNGETFREANDLLTEIREEIIEILKKEDDSFDLAWELIGRFLHILQMFYSNTNWVEMFGSDAYYSLGIRGKPLFAQAPLAMMTCQNCGERDEDSCNDTLLTDGVILTSGYRSGQDVHKPYRHPIEFTTGKCSHGGLNDESGTTVAALGGINKDSTMKSLSPHYYLHKPAAQAAINHTTFFFNDKDYGLRYNVDEDKFKRFLQLRSGKSLVFVVDDTGSMSDDIVAVKEQIVTIIQNKLGTAKEPSNYVFTLFNDPENLTRSFQTEGSEEALQYVRNISVFGGGDCPEYSMSGIALALTLSKPEPDIYIFTDASAKDSYNARLVLNLASQKQARMTFLLTGDCGGRRKREIYSQGMQVKTSTRSKRSAQGIDLYNALASATGGSVYVTNKSGISKLANIISEIALTSPVTIFKRQIEPGFGDINIPVDNTVRELTLDITGIGSVTLNEQIYNSTDDLQLSNMNITDLGIGKLIKINAPTPGVWRVSGLNSSSWNVHITALSTLDISTMFVQLDSSTGFEFQIKGRPVAGEEATIIVTVPSADLIISLDEIQLLNDNGTEIGKYSNLTLIEGRANTSLYRAKLQLPTQKFQVAVLGKDLEGNLFTRLQTEKITPVAIELNLLPLNETLFINESLTITFTVSNKGDAESNITVTVQDDQHFAQDPLTQDFTLDPHQNATGQLTLLAGPKPGVITTVTVTATTTSATGDTSQFQIIRLSARKRVVRPVDNDIPICNITSITGHCDAKMTDPCTCKQNKWSGTAEISDEGFGLYQITSSAENSQGFVHETFALGHTAENGTIKANISGDCCNPLLYINVVDMASNTGQCVFNLAPDVKISATACKPSKPTDVNTLSGPTLTIIAAAAGASAVVVVLIVVVIGCVVFRSKKAAKVMDSSKRKR